MTCCTLILLFVHHELNYDTYHPNADHIYRILRETRTENTDPFFSPGTSGNLGPTLQRDFPEIQEMARIWEIPETYVQHQTRGFTQKLLMADPSVLTLFSLPLLKGDSNTALEQPYSILITKEMAEKYFGQQDPIGKIIQLTHRFARGDYQVTGILETLPHNTQLRFDFLTATKDTELTSRAWGVWKSTSTWRPIQTFIRLPKHYNPDVLKSKLPDFMAQYMGESVRTLNTYHLQPLKRIHLYSQRDFGMISDGDIAHILLSSTIAALIMVIACINFMNLATARSAERAQEVGLRKVVGANKSALVLQFLGEAMLLSLLGLLLAMILAKLCLPAFNGFMGKHLTLDVWNNGPIIVVLFFLVLFVGALSGAYPAFFLSAFQPVDVLKGSQKAGSWGIYIRKGLVVFQFAISIILIVSTFAINKQQSYIQNKNLGFNKTQVIVMPLFLRDRSLAPRYEAIKKGFLRHPNVLKATATLRSIDEAHSFRVVRPEGITDDALRMHLIWVDEDYVDTFEMQIVQGRNLSKTITSDSTAFILNETAVKLLGWKDPIGKQFELTLFRIRGPVIGVVKDFHFGSLHTPLGPAFINKIRTNQAVNWLTVRISSNNLEETIAFLESEWKRHIPNQPFEYAFLDDQLDRLYDQEKRLGQMFTIFALLAIFVACLGMFGLAAFTTEQRTKEIGIRKVLGASTFDILRIIAKEFVRLVLFANVIAWPIAYMAINQWLQNFAYRITLDPIPFLLGGLLALSIALTVVSYQAIKAATANPINTLKYE